MSVLRLLSWGLREFEEQRTTFSFVFPAIASYDRRDASHLKEIVCVVGMGEARTQAGFAR